MAPFETADLAAPQSQISRQLYSQFHRRPLQCLEQLLHSFRIIVMVHRLCGGRPYGHFYHIALNQVLLSGLFQSIVENAVMLAYCIGTQS